MKRSLSVFFATVFLVVVVVGVFSCVALADVMPVSNPSDLILVATGQDSNGNALGLYFSGGTKYAYYGADDSHVNVIAMGTSSFTSRLYLSTNGATPVEQNTYSSYLSNGIYYRTWYINDWIMAPRHLELPLSIYPDWSSAVSDYSNDYTPPAPDPDPTPSPSLNDGGLNLSVGSNYPITVVVPAGYMLCVEGDLGSITFEQSFDDYSALFQVSGFWWWGSSAFTRDASTLPVIGTSYSINPDGASRIAFLRGEPKNFAGQSRNGYLSSTFDNAGDYLLIFNPQINWYNDHGLASSNHDLIVTFRTRGGVDSIRAYPISSPTYSYLGDEFIDCTVVSDPYLLSLSGLWRDPTEVQNLVALPSSANGTEETSVLDGLVSDIDQLVSGLWSHIRTLSDLLGQFPNAIVSIYSWLPSDYRALLACLFGISCTVGVLKVLL